MGRAEHHMKGGDMMTAEVLCQQVLAQDKANTDAMGMLGLIALYRRQFERAREILSTVVVRQPHSYTLHGNLGICLAELGEEQGAVHHFQEAIRLNPKSVELYHNLAEFYEKLNKLDKAQDAIEQALRMDPASVWTAYYLAKIKNRRGTLDEAAAILEKITADHPEHPLMPRVFHLQGKVYDRLQKYHQAFASFSKANLLNAKSVKALELKTKAEKIIQRLADYRAWLQENRKGDGQWFQPDDGFPAPVFLTGFPRSGTTLIDQILNSHSRIITLSEKPTLATISDDFFFSAKKPSELAALTDVEVKRYRADYWQRVHRLTGGTEANRTVVDRMPLYFVYLPIIQRLFPEAKVMVMIRNPLDVCLSNFAQDYVLTPFMLHFLTLEGAADFYSSVMKFYLLCRSVLPMQFIQFRYEDLVEDLSGEAQRLLHFLGLEWEGKLLDYQQTAKQRLIKTPSYEQVVQPLYKKAIDRWRNYAEFLEPIIPKVAPYLKEFGYEEVDS